MTEPDDFLDRERARYEDGDKLRLPYALGYCIDNHHPIPPWLATAFAEARRKVFMDEVESWDDVFGRPLKKGEHLAKQRKDAEIGASLFCRVEERHSAGENKDNDLFYSVGKEFGVGTTHAKTLYYDVLREMIADD